jgi:hypothetical protein
VAAVLVMVCAGPLAACGGGTDPEDVAQYTEDFGTVGGEVSADTYARAFCTAFKEVTNVANAGKNGSDFAGEAADKGGSSFEDVLFQYDQHLRSMSTYAGRARDALHDIGYPRVPEGEALARRARQLIGFGPQIVATRAKIDSLSRSSPEWLVERAEVALEPFARDLLRRLQALISLARQDNFSASFQANCTSSTSVRLIPD